MQSRPCLNRAQPAPIPQRVPYVPANNPPPAPPTRSKDGIGPTTVFVRKVRRLCKVYTWSCECTDLLVERRRCSNICWHSSSLYRVPRSKRAIVLKFGEVLAPSIHGVDSPCGMSRKLKFGLQGRWSAHTAEASRCTCVPHAPLSVTRGGQHRERGSRAKIDTRVFGCRRWM